MIATTALFAFSFFGLFGFGGDEPSVEDLQSEVRELQVQVSNMTARVEALEMTSIRRPPRLQARSGTISTTPRSKKVFGVSSSEKIQIDAGMNLLGERFPIDKNRKNEVIVTEKLPPAAKKRVLKKPIGKPVIVAPTPQVDTVVKPNNSDAKPSSEASINDTVDGGVK